MHAIDPSIKRGITPAIHRATPRAIHPARVVLHWLLAAMLLFMMGMGGLVLQHMPNTAPAKLGALQGHMIGGAAILALMLVRWIVRWRTAPPPTASNGQAGVDRRALRMHRALYVAVFAMALSGFALSITSGLGQVVFGGVGNLPASFDAFTARTVHGIVAKVLLVLMVVHVAAALYHQWICRQGVLQRMGLRRRRPGEAA